MEWKSMVGSEELKTKEETVVDRMERMSLERLDKGINGECDERC